jgi:hypothetical protein
MLPDLYRTFETSTLKDLVSYGDPADEEPGTEVTGGADDGVLPRRPVRGGRSRSWPSLRRAKAKWLRLGWRTAARTELG